MIGLTVLANSSNVSIGWGKNVTVNTEFKLPR